MTDDDEPSLCDFMERMWDAITTMIRSDGIPCATYKLNSEQLYKFYLVLRETGCVECTFSDFAVEASLYRFDCMLTANCLKALKQVGFRFEVAQPPIHFDDTKPIPMCRLVASYPVKGVDHDGVCIHQ